MPRPTGLPAALELQPPEAVPVNHCLSLLCDGDRVIYFAFTVPFTSHPADDTRARNRCLAQCALHQLATLAELARAFGLSTRTVLRARQRLEREGEAGFAPQHKSRRRHGIEDPEILQRAAQMLASGTSLRQTARELDLCYATLRTYRLQGLLPAVAADPPPASPAPAPAAGPASQTPGQPAAGTPVADAPPAPAEPLATPTGLDREQRNRRDAQAPQGRATHDTQGRVEASLGLLAEREPRFEAPASAVAGGGVLAALPALLAEGLLAHRGLLRLPPGYFGVRSILLTLAFLLLLRVQRAERLGYEQPGEWGQLLGLDRCPCPRTLRRRLRQLVADPEALAAWRGALAQGWSEQDADAVATLYVDGHVQVYTGQGQLPKQFVPRQKLCLPGATSYWVNALGGAPLLCVHKAVDSSLVAEIRDGIVPRLEALGLLGGAADAQRPRLTLVFDREGWSPALFAELRRQGIAVISWRKGAQTERWPAQEFLPASLPLPGPLGVIRLEGRAAERAVELGPHGRVREIRFWIDRRLPLAGRHGAPRKPQPRSGEPRPGQRQPSAITTHPSLPLEQVAGLLRSRWTQENFFKYMRQEFGLDTLADRTLEDVDADERVVNPAWRFLNNALARRRAQLGTLHRRLAEAPRGSEQASGLKEQVATVTRYLEGLQTARQEVDHYVRAGDLPEEQRLKALAEPMRELLDAVRMIAYRAETRLAGAVAPGLSRPETARLLVKALFRSDASLLPDPDAGTLTVRLMHQASRGRDIALAPLLKELNQTRTVYPGTNLRLVYEILPTDPDEADGPAAS